MNDIIIEGNKYRQLCVGNRFPQSVTLEQYGLTVQDLKINAEIEKKIKDYPNYVSEKAEWILDLLSWCFGITLSVASFAYYYFNTESPSLDYCFTIILSCIGLVFPIYVIMLISRGCAYAIAPPCLTKRLIRHFIKEPCPYYKSKIIQQYTINNNCTKKIQDEIKERYGVSKSDNFCYETYCKESLLKLVERILKYIEQRNKDISLQNRKLEQDWWYKLDPYQFEKEVAKWFERKGYKCKVTPKSGDGGKDIVVTKNGIASYVQCKRFTTRKVDRPTLDGLLGVMTRDKIQGGFVVCLGGLTEDARKHLRESKIVAYTINDLAPQNDLFNHVTPSPLLSTNISPKNADNLISIGPFQLQTTTYSGKEYIKNDKTVNDESKINLHLLESSSLYWCVQCETELFNGLQEYIHNLEKPVRIPAPTPTKREKNKHRRRSYWNYYY